MPTDTFVSIFEEPSSGSTATSSGASGVEHDRVVQLLGCHAPRPARCRSSVDDHVVRDDVQLLLDVAAAVIAARGAERAGQGACADELRDRAARVRQGGYGGCDFGAARVVASPEGQMLVQSAAAAIHDRLPLCVVLVVVPSSTSSCQPWIAVEHPARPDVARFERHELAHSDGALVIHESHRLPQSRAVECVAQRARVREVRLLPAQRDVLRAALRERGALSRYSASAASFSAMSSSSSSP